MTVTKAELYSIKIKKKVIAQECLLWKRFIQQQPSDWMSFYPASKGGADWETRVECYQPKNHGNYHALLTKLDVEMKQQNTIFSAVLPQQNKSTKAATLNAIDLLEQENKELGYALRRLVGRILIVECQHLVAFSSMASLGLVVIAPKPSWKQHDYMENLIHEMSHIELYIKQMIDHMVKGQGYLKSPLRNHLRPINAVFHSVFVLARIVFYLKPLAQAQADSSPLNIRLSQCVKLLEKGLNQFNDPGALTPAGGRIINEIDSLIRTQRNEAYAQV